jgi:cyclopropane fatty-acyl-phospholipid synthase-like methyltransferase
LQISKEQAAEMLRVDEFPLSNEYDPEWVMDNQMGPNALWLTEWLCEKMHLRPGMRVLDMGCGMAMSSVFLAREFAVTVWANDLWIKPTENWERIREAGLEDRVFPIHAEARSLPYAEGFFDAILSLDSYQYYGTDDLYLKYFARFVRPGGRIGIVVPGLMREFEGEVPEHLTRTQASGGVFWDPKECFSFHTVEWWRRHWERTGLVDVEIADTMPDGWRLWLQFDRALCAAGKNRFPSDEETLEADAGQYLGFIRMVARPRGDD